MALTQSALLELLDAISSAAVADLLRQAKADIAAVADFPEAHDEWQVADRRYLSEASMAQLTPPAPVAIEPRRDTTQEVIDNPDLKTA